MEPSFSNMTKKEEGYIIAINGVWLCCFINVSWIFREATPSDFSYASITDDIRKYALQDDLPSAEDITEKLGSPVCLVKIFIILIFLLKIFEVPGLYDLHSHRQWKIHLILKTTESWNFDSLYIKCIYRYILSLFSSWT